MAYSPRPSGGLFKRLLGDNDKTVIRAGFSRVYDRAGFALLNSFDQIGAAGLTTTIQNTCCTFGVTSAEDLPRITGIHQIPQTNLNGVQFLLPPPPPTWPQIPAVNAQANLWGTDNTMKTPHAYTADFSIGRELPKRFSVQLSYVGRFGRDLLTQRDLTQPLDIVDPKTGIDYYKAASALSNLARSFALANNGGAPTNYYQGFPTTAQIGSVTAAMLGPTAQYWVNMLPKLRPGAAQYQDLFTCFIPCYHALQANLKKQFSHGIQFDLNYTYSKSLDITSAASRVGFSVYGYQNIGLVGSRLANAFSPNLARAVSDFDLTHQVNLNWIAELPFGKGRAFAGNDSGLLDAFIGGWQLSGLARWTSGFPFSVDGGQRWPTDWFLTAITQMTSRPRTGTFKGNGRVNIFADPAAAQADFTLPLPGQVGSRNVLRGNGFAGLDMSLVKRWKMPYAETHSLEFRWEVFNVPNLTRFNAQAVGSSLLTSLTQSPNSFGAYTSLLTQPRVMQFALRYEF